ncbi:MAG: hypothetical protein JXA03_14320 [Bacteroidales bacterium]|nr:hypothetical protein [Bacteroidales bacterium]
MRIPFIYLLAPVAVLIFILTSGIGMAQSDPPLRLETEVKSDDASYRIVPCGNNGLILFYESTLTEEERKIWIFVFYDVNLHEKWKTEVPLDKQVGFAKDAFNGTHAHIIFHAPDRKKANNNYQIVRIETGSGETEVFGGNVPDKSLIRDFRLMGSMALIGYNGEKYSGIIAHDLKAAEQKDFFQNDSTFSQIECIYSDTARNTIWAVFNNFYSKTLFYFTVIQFEQGSGRVTRYYLPPSEGKKCNTAALTVLDDGNLLVIGTYDNTKNRDTDIKNYFSNEATGFFTTKIENGSIGSPSYYNFIDFENITGYLKASEFMNARKKANKKGAENLSLDYDLLIHDIYSHHGLFYFIAEGFYEEYHTVTNTYYDYYGRPMPLSYSVFDGYRYFNTFVTCFDGDGKKKWDNGLEIFNILAFDLKKMVTVFFDSTSLVLAYNREGKIAAKIIDEGETIEGTDYFPLEASYANDRIIEDKKSIMVPWYGNYFLCYGFQTIRNDSFIGKERRLVFYLNKVAFR